jgi:hypothetical protein
VSRLPRHRPLSRASRAQSSMRRPIRRAPPGVLTARDLDCTALGASLDSSWSAAADPGMEPGDRPSPRRTISTGSFPPASLVTNSSGRAIFAAIHAQMGPVFDRASAVFSGLPPRHVSRRRHSHVGAERR